MTTDADFDTLTISFEEPSDMIKSWSHSRAVEFDKCNLRAKFLIIDRLKEPERPLKEGQTEQANDRGQRIHEAAELFVRGGVELIPELKDFQPEFSALRTLFSEGHASLEGEWGFNNAWQPVGYMSSDCWLRLKLDAMVMMDPKWAVVIDYKSGRRSGNELKHAGQTQLYTVATLLKYPEIERVTTELWYVDQNELTRVEYTREQGMRFFKVWNDKGIKMTTATEFLANPNKFSCQWCRFGPKYNGPCKVGV